MMIETTGKKVLFLRGYTGMSASMVLLTVALYFQASLLQRNALFYILFYYYYYIYIYITFSHKDLSL